MDNDKRKKLEERRQQLQVKLEATAYIEQHINPSRELLDGLRQYGLRYQIVGLVYIPLPYHTLIRQTIAQPPYSGYGFQSDHLPQPRLEALLDDVFNRYPSTNPFRYVPDLTEYENYSSLPQENGFRYGLLKTVQALNLPDQDVYVYYLQYNLVFALSLRDLATHEHEELFNTWHGDVLIFSAHRDWLIAFTLEEEWFGGKK